jgi:hypothetical protein
LRKESKIIVPDRNQEAAISSIQTDFGKEVEIRHEPELRGGFALLAKKGTKDFVMLLRNLYNIESALDVIETWIRISGHPYRHEVSHTKHTYIIQHDMGRNWSLYLAKLYQYLFEEFELKKVDFDVNNNTLDFVVDTEK